MVKHPFKKVLESQSWGSAVARLKEGASPFAVAEFMQSMGDCKDIKIQSLARQIARYKTQVLAIKQTLSEMYVDKAISNLDLVINELEEMAKLILIQKQRIGKNLEFEASLPSKMPLSKILRPEIESLFTMLEKRARLMSDVGLLPKAPQRNVNLNLGDESFARILDGIPDDDSRLRLRRLVQEVYTGHQIGELGDKQRDVGGPGTDGPESAGENGYPDETKESPGTV